MSPEKPLRIRAVRLESLPRARRGGLPRHTKNTQTRSMRSQELGVRSQEDCEALRFQFLRGSRFWNLIHQVHGLNSQRVLFALGPIYKPFSEPWKRHKHPKKWGATFIAWWALSLTVPIPSDNGSPHPSGTGLTCFRVRLVFPPRPALSGRQKKQKMLLFFGLIPINKKK